MRTRLLVACIAAVSAAPVLAATAADAVPGAGLTLGNTPDAAIPSPATAPVTRVDDEQPKDPNAAVMVDVKAVTFTGNKLVPTSELTPYVKDLVGKQVSVAELKKAAAAVQSHYRNQGYFLTNAHTSADRVKDGVVEIRVIEWVNGRKNIFVAEDSPLKESRVQGYFDHIEAGSPVQSGEIERAILALRNVPAIRVRSSVRPGVNLGEADATLNVTRGQATFGGSVRADNWGNRNTGRARGIVDLQSRGLFGQGELISVVGLLAESGNTEFGRLSVDAPVGSRGTTANFTYSLLKYGVGKAFKDLDADGLGETLSMSVSHPLVLRRNLQVNAGLGYEHKRANDRQFDKTLDDARRLDNGNFTLGINHQGDDADSLYQAAEITVTRGDVNIRTLTSQLLDEFDVIVTPGGIINNLPREVTGKFTKVAGKYLAIKPVRGNDQILLSIRGQTANKNLDPLERASLGGPVGVRAFPVGTGFGDRVYLQTLEYRYFVSQFSPLGSTVYWNSFWDVGHVKYNIDNPGFSDNTMVLSGIGTGFTIAKPEDFNIKVDVATRVGGDKYTDDDSRDIRVWMSGTKFF